MHHQRGVGGQPPNLSTVSFKVSNALSKYRMCLSVPLKSGFGWARAATAAAVAAAAYHVTEDVCQTPNEHSECERPAHCRSSAAAGHRMSAAFSFSSFHSDCSRRMLGACAAEFLGGEGVRRKGVRGGGHSNRCKACTGEVLCWPTVSQRDYSREIIDQ